MNRPWFAVLLCSLAVGLSACDRALPEAEAEDEQGSRFEAEVRQVGGGGFELMAGTASYDLLAAQGETDVLVLRFASVLPNQNDTTRLSFVLPGRDLPAPGLYPVGDLEEVQTVGPRPFVGCYRSPNFMGTRYVSESGEVAVENVGTSQVGGAFEATVYADVQTGPDTVVRTRLKLSGSFEATRRTMALDVEGVLACRF